mmetsp:Transcript_15420/g.21100  ORF Transcript_15420/g.21100 Transcript_15420/m.21100 type:complete len:612 (+) Transcript_15420:16-1851(+)
MTEKLKIVIKESKRRRFDRRRPKRLQILRKCKHLRSWLLRNPWLRPLAVFNYASILIQKIFRGYYIRKHKINNLKKLEAFRKSKSKGKPKAKSKRGQLDKYLEFIESCKKKAKKKPLWLDGGYSSWCAVRIQSTWRMFICSRRYQRGKRLINQVASIIIQTFWRNYFAAKYGHLKKQINAVAAVHMIQSIWRAFCNKRVYRYFRDLVVTKLKGAPADLLRTIIPNEIDLMDRAAGVHVRFRLGGSTFPPKIFFKVYTHKPVCDVNAFAPRDYSNERPLDPQQVHNKFQSINLGSKRLDVGSIRVGKQYFDAVLPASVGATDQWYQRDEKNNWRSISSRLFESIAAPPWHRESVYESKPKPFHYSKLRRHQELLKDKKRRKREWLMKAYLLSTATEREQQGATPGPKVTLPTPQMAPLQYNPNHRNSNNTNSGLDASPRDSPPSSPLLLSPHNHTLLQSARNYQNDSKEDHSPHSRSPHSKHRKRVTIRHGTSSQEKKVATVIEHIQRIKGCMYSKNSHLMVALKQPLNSSLQQGTTRHSFKEEYLNDDYSAPDEEVDLMLWSSALNYDEYAKEWASLGTSMPSDVSDDMIYTAALAGRAGYDRDYYGTVKP